MFYKKSEKYRELAQIVHFGVTHPEFFPEGSRAATLLSRLVLAHAEVSNFATSHYLGTGAVWDSGDVRAGARTAVRDQMTVIYQTVCFMGVKGFWLPLSKSDDALYDAGLGFVEKAEPIKDELIANGLPADFLEKFKEAVDGLANALRHVKDSRGKRIAAMEGFDKTMTQAKADLKVSMES